MLCTSVAKFQSLELSSHQNQELMVSCITNAEIYSRKYSDIKKANSCTVWYRRRSRRSGRSGARWTNILSYHNALYCHKLGISLKKAWASLLVSFSVDSGDLVQTRPQPMSCDTVIGNFCGAPYYFALPLSKLLLRLWVSHDVKMCPWRTINSMT